MYDSIIGQERDCTMGYVLEHKAKTIFITASLVRFNGRPREVVIENRPQFAIVQLKGSKQRYAVAWEKIYNIAKAHHQENLQLESDSQRKRKGTHREKRAS
jgi:hypothetical protein